MYYSPALRELVRVIPVAQSQTHDDTILTFLSIDCYDDGWIANLRVHRLGSYGYPVFNFFPKRHPRPARQYGGSGASEHHREDDPNWYFSYVYYHGLAPDEPPLEFEVPVMRFTDRPRQEGGALVAEVPGPWRFVVPLSGGLDTQVIVSMAARWAPLNAKERAERQQQTMPIYGPIFDEVLEILYRYDPIVAWSDPSGAEWYTSVTYRILDRIPAAWSAADVRDIALEEFRARWGSTFQWEERFDEIGALIWEAWQRRQRERE